MPIHFEALIFDMDGTLFDTEPLHRKAWRRVFDSFNVNLNDEEIIRFNGSSPEDVAKGLIEIKNVRADPFHLAKQKKNIMESFLIKEKIEKLPSAALVAQLHGVRPLGLATGSGASTAKKLLQRFDYLKYFGAIVTADDVIHHKPAPDTFLICAERLGVSPARCIVFEDSLFGVAAAKKAGMAVIDVNDKTESALNTLLSAK